MKNKILKLIFGLSLIVSGCTKPSELKVSDSHASDLSAPTPSDSFDPGDCGYSAGEIACNFELTDSSGSTIELYDFKDDIIILDFSTAWCYYCQQAAIDVQAIQDAHESQGLVYITVLIEGFDRQPPTEDLLKEWTEHFVITTAPVLGGDHTLLDPAGESGWYVEAWPTFYYIDRDMRIAQYQRGFSAASLNAMIESLLSN